MKHSNLKEAEKRGIYVLISITTLIIVFTVGMQVGKFAKYLFG